VTYEELKQSREILGLPERATLGEIKDRYRTLAKDTHPDAQTDAAPESFRRIHQAYRIVLEYANAYRISFSENEFYEQNPEERLRKQFQDDPVWGGK
jgi:DnaJ-class molecular chaperone